MLSYPVLLDGATGTNLYIAGMPQGVCVEEWILQNPDALIDLQTAFINAGSDVIFAPTFGSNRNRLKQYSLEGRTAEYNKKLVALSKKAAGGKARVAGDISPSGLFAEPFGDAHFSELLEIYREQADALSQAGVDLFIIETMMSLADIRAAVLACREFGKEIYATITINEKGKTLSGLTPLTALIILQELGISAFGLNCSEGPQRIAEEIKKIQPYAKIPLIAKPNAGHPNPIIPNFYDMSPTAMKESMKEALDAGASVIGGCCGTTPEHIKAMRELLDNYSMPKLEYNQSSDILLADEKQFFSLDPSLTEFSEPIVCESDMADLLLDISDADIILVSVNSEDDGWNFSQNAHFANLPVCFVSSSAAALENALLLYNGRAMVDKHSVIEEAALIKLCKKYGAVLY